MWAVWVVLLLTLVLGDNPFTDGIALREAQGKRLRPTDYATTYFWWMALVNVLALPVVLTTWRLWQGPAEVPDFPRFEASEPRPPRWLIAGVLLAMASLAFTAAPRMTYSLWEDEKYMVVRTIAGAYGLEQDGSLEYSGVGWRDTFFYYRKPNNHVPYSVVARLAHEGWSAITRPRDLRVNEVVVRLPALAAALAGLGMLAWALWRIGLPMAALAGAWVLALHPWYLRYATEVRGYAFLLALLPALVIASSRVLERGTWRRWITLGVVEVLLLWTYPGALFVLVVAAIFIFVELLRAPAEIRAVQPTRYLVTNVVAGLAWLQMNLPNMMQFLPYSDVWKGEVTTHLLRHVGSYLLFGMPWYHSREGFVSFQDQLSVHPGSTTFVLVAILVVILIGIVRMARRGSPSLGALLILVVPAPLTILLAAVRGDHLYPWYLIHALPGVAMLVGAGVTVPAAFGPTGRRVAMAMTLGSLGVFFVATQPMRSIVRERALQPTRDMVRSIRPNPDLFAPEQDRILTGAVYGPPRYYDPRVVDLPTAQAVREMMGRADREGLPLFVTYNRPGLARRRRPEALAMLEREEWFERVGVFEGVEPKSTHVVYRYRPGSLESAAETD
ncbi:MAG: hypothetical protein GY723_01125 [bacterium]|nr:hypothetical protein [bacterium]